jgi:hypothetical protein
MNTTLLRASRRHRSGARLWLIPGAPNAARLIPTGSIWGDVPSFSWPHRLPDGSWVVRGVRLDWHRHIAKQAARDIIAMYETAC